MDISLNEYKEAVDKVRLGNKASVSFLQRNLHVGYNRASHLLDKMEHDGVVSAPNEHGRRKVLAL